MDHALAPPQSLRFREFVGQEGCQGKQRLVDANVAVKVGTRGGGASESLSAQVFDLETILLARLKRAD